MKLVLVGGGGFRVPTMVRALGQDRPGVPVVDEVVLHDTDPARLAAIGAVLSGMPRGPRSPSLSATTGLDEALRGADAVFVAIRVGGVAARVADERVALDLGLVGQETTGAGGIAFGLRTVPEVVRIAGRIAALAPEALVVDFTNPAGMITEAAQTVLGDRVVGICDTPADLVARACAAAGVDPATAEPDYVGLNHLGWLRGLVSDGVDVLPGLLADPARLAGLEEADVFGSEWLGSSGWIPNEYLWYWYRTREAVRALAGARATRGELLRDQQDAFYAAVERSPAGAARRWEQTMAARNAGYMAEARAGESGDADRVAGLPDGYAGVALAVLAAARGGPPARLVLNVANAGTVTALPDDAVVEVPSLVDAAGIRPLPLRTQPDLHQLGTMAAVKAVERLTIGAALSGSPTLAEQAFALHPLVDSTSSARALLAGYRASTPEVAAVFTRERRRRTYTETAQASAPATTA